jgi:ribosomal protein L7Ae-like RNA K-turn-binding protein
MVVCEGERRRKGKLKEGEKELVKSVHDRTSLF